MTKTYYLMICLAVCSVMSANCQQKVAITIDDFPLISLDRSPDNQIYVIDQLINHLNQSNAPAIAFVNDSKLFDQDGNKIDMKVKQLEKWLDAGYDLGNHGFAHLNFDRTDTATYFADILKGEEVSKPITINRDKEYRYFRHPFLHAGDTEVKELALEAFLQRHGYEEAPVTIDNSEWIYARAYDIARETNDTAKLNAIGQSYVDYMVEKSEYFSEKSEALFNRPINQVLLIHTNNINADYLDDLLEALKEKRYEFISLKDAIADPAYETNDHIAKPWGISWVHRWSRNMGVDKAFYQGEPKCPQFIQDYAGIQE